MTDLTIAPHPLPYARWIREWRESAVAGAWNAVRPGKADFISFAGGKPSPDLFPAEALERAYVAALREEAADALQYSPSQGIEPLRALVAERLRARGVRVEADHVVITSGSAQGLHLAGLLFLDHGDTVVVEGPTFVGALGSWEPMQPRYVTLPVDDAGLVVEALEAQLRGGSRPKLVYVLPTFQNPTGVTLPLERRRAILRLAHEYDFVVLEDDPYCDLWFERGAADLPPIAALPGAEDRVLYLGSFSKTLAPGLRLGFAVGSPLVAHWLAEAKSGVDFHTNALGQHAAVRLLRVESGFDFAAHLAHLRSAYRARRDAMLDALESGAPPGTRWTRPAGGFFVWVDLPGGLPATAVVPHAQQAGVGFVPGASFYAGEGGASSLRLAFSFVQPGEVTRGVQRLNAAIRLALAEAA